MVKAAQTDWEARAPKKRNAHHNDTKSQPRTELALRAPGTRLSGFRSAGMARFQHDIG